ncbi:hypothetical protein T492DRAFT_833776 [Pavlovales sp. CCMP2436]|nr:hypothetical protein T492DRAFT_833776 [Pavlovales sp. CCMP2436]
MNAKAKSGPHFLKYKIDTSQAARCGKVSVETVSFSAGSVVLPSGGTLSAPALGSNLDANGFEVQNAILRDATLVGVSSIQGAIDSSATLGTLQVLGDTTLSALSVASLTVYADGTDSAARRRLQVSFELGGAGVNVPLALSVGGDTDCTGELTANSLTAATSVQAQTVTATSALLASVLAPSTAFVADGNAEVLADELALSTGEGVALVGSGVLRTSEGALTFKSASDTIHLGDATGASAFEIGRTAATDANDGGMLSLVGQSASGAFGLTGGHVLVSGGDASGDAGMGGWVMLRGSSVTLFPIEQPLNLFIRGASGATTDGTEPLVQILAAASGGGEGADTLVVEFLRGQATFEVPVAMGSGGVALNLDGSGTRF